MQKRQKELQSIPQEALRKRDKGRCKAYRTNVKNAPFTGRAGSCAVVFASGVMLKDKRYGAAIDCFDHVYRMNAHSVLGYEEYAGSRTTHHTVSFNNNLEYQTETGESVVYSTPANAFVSEFSQDVMGISFIPHIQEATKPDLIKKHPNWKFYHGLKQILYRSPILNFSTFGALECNMRKKTNFHCKRLRDPTSGFFTVALAIRDCDKVTLFGSVDDCHFPYHYSSVEAKSLPYQPPASCTSVYSLANHSKIREDAGGHSFTSEHQLYKDLVKEGLITLDTHGHEGWCKPNAYSPAAKSIPGDEKVLPYDLVFFNRRLITLLKESTRDPHVFTTGLPIQKALEEAKEVESKPVINSPIKLAKLLQENIKMGFPFLVIPACNSSNSGEPQAGERKDPGSFDSERWSTKQDELAHGAFLRSILVNLEALHGHAHEGSVIRAGTINADLTDEFASGGGWHVDDDSCLGTGRCECPVQPNSVKMVQLLGGNRSATGTKSPF
jgi:hypothetical protein